MKPDGTAVQDNDLLDDAYFTPAIDTVKVPTKEAGVRVAMLIEAAAAHARAVVKGHAIGSWPPPPFHCT